MTNNNIIFWCVIICLIIIIIVLSILLARKNNSSRDNFKKFNLIEYKIKEQNIWPFPNKIQTGSLKNPKSLTVSSKLSIKDFPISLQAVLKPVVDDFNNFVGFSKSSKNKLYNISINNPSHTDHNGSERYQLHISNGKGIVIKSDTYIGTVRALTTLSQLIRKDGNNYVIKNIDINIDDEPHYQYRSAMLDTTRHYLPVETKIGRAHV